jgi:hypothetical protein
MATLYELTLRWLLNLGPVLTLDNPVKPADPNCPVKFYIPGGFLVAMHTRGH